MKHITILLFLSLFYVHTPLQSQSIITIEASNCWAYSKEVINLSENENMQIDINYKMYNSNMNIIKEKNSTIKLEEWKSLKKKIIKKRKQFECAFSKMGNGYTLKFEGDLEMILCDYNNKLIRKIFNQLHLEIIRD